AVLRAENRRHLAGRGFVVYLKASIDDLFARTSRDKRRPLLQTTDRRKVLSEIIATRGPLYEEVADVIIATGRNSVKDVVAEVLRQIPQI
ncbi:MAG: shikimate kinase, partial [Pseudomonadales bacterium]|nr:shikimate kinase [Pseudomonadales bacterium]